MTSLALLRAHARIGFLDLVRWPGYVVPTVVFPAMFYALFDLPFARTRSDIADSTMLAFTAFAIVGVALYQFGVGIAQERGRPWERYLRTLPVSAAVRVGARILTAALFGLATAAAVALVARCFTPIDLDAAQWLRALIYAALAARPVRIDGPRNRLLGVGSRGRSDRDGLQLAARVRRRTLDAARISPAVRAKISPLLPTRAFADLLWSVTGDGHAARAAVTLVAYTLIFAAIAAAGYRRDERTRYA